MQIYTTDWHYRLVKLFYRSYEPKNLCQYFWTAMSCLFWVSLLPLYFIGMGIEKIFGYFEDGDKSSNGIGLRVFVGLISPLLLIVGVLFLFSAVFSIGINSAVKKSSMIAAFFTVKKDKVCSLIEVM